jgi:soluble lytic murein transglycosylase-like protein
MISWLIGVVVCLAFLVGCGGGPKSNLVKVDQTQPEIKAPLVNDSQDDGTLAEELSAKRLEELYAKSGIPGWDPGVEEELNKWEHQVNFDVPIQVNKQVRAYLVYFSTERKKVIERYLARSSRYLPMIKRIFQEAGLPEDLAYLAMIESGFNPKAYSRAAASGMWQFIRGTGLRYGLTIDRYVDERRDPEKSTRAAAKYLLDLYKQFGSWYLAAASYNCGEARVQRELNDSNHKNFWELSANQCLPTETKNYVPQMIAATIIAKNPKKFGFKNIAYLPPLQYDKVRVDEPTSLTAAAMAVNVPTEEVQDLNPELLRGITPPDMPSYTLYLPANSKDLFGRNITLARIEHPAVASHPTRTASRSRHSYDHRRTYHHHRYDHAALARRSHNQKSESRTYARSSHKRSSRVYAKKSTHTKYRAPARASVVQASMLGTPSLASRHRNSKKTRVARLERTRSRSKHHAVKGNGVAETRLARKMNKSSRNSSRIKRSSRHSRERYSRSKSKRDLVISEVR